MNLRIVSYVLGWALNIEGACMLLPFICSLAYNEERKWIFPLCALICLLAGVILTCKAPTNKSMFAKEGFVAVALSWIAISIFGTLPFVISGEIPNFFDALFEVVSGFTTTGASILTDVEAMPKSFLLWRSFAHWIGGMGVLVFLVAVLPLSGGSNLYLIRAESTGPAVSKLVPRVRTTAKILYSIYMGITILQIILLMLGGLDLFEASAISFGTVGTGGFAVKNSGVSGYSPYIQNTITVFMIICGVDFSFYYLLIMRKIREALKMEEVRTYLGIIIVSTTLICINIASRFDNVFDTIRHSAFQVSSLMTTTGFSTIDYDSWPEFSKLILIGLMFCGACAGSTAGGIKVSRILILFKTIIKEVKVLVHPKSTVKVKFNGRVLEHETLRSINVFFIAYVLVFACVLLIISIDNFDFTTNFTAVVATLSNIGPGLAKVGPVCNFSEYSYLSKFALTFAMIIGRLEIFPILVLFSKKTWKK